LGQMRNRTRVVASKSTFGAPITPKPTRNNRNQGYTGHSSSSETGV
jgi:hypothetical protein